MFETNRNALAYLVDTDKFRTAAFAKFHSLHCIKSKDVSKRVAYVIILNTSNLFDDE